MQGQISSKGLLVAGAAFFFCLLSQTASWAGPGPYTFTKIADAADLVPNSATPFGSFEYFPVIGGSNVAFSVSRNLPAHGVYTGDGTSNSTIIQRGMSLPNGAGTIHFLNGYSQDGSVTVFNALSDTGAFEGVFRSTAGVITPVALPGAMIPASDGSLPAGSLGFAAIPSADGGAVAFNGSTSRGQGIYSNVTGSLKAVADHFTPVPGIPGAVFSSLSPPALRGGKMAFQSSQFTTPGNSIVPGQGVYIADATTGVIARVVDLTTAKPGGGTFSNFDAIVAFDGSNVAFQQTGASAGVYASIGGVLRLVADTNTLIPGSTVPFGHFNGLAIGNGRVVFGGDLASGVADFQTGVYLWDDGVITPILRRGDVIDGRTVSNIAFNNESMEGDRLALQIGSDQGTAIYETLVPEPGSAMLLGLGLSGWVCWRRRKVGLR